MRHDLDPADEIRRSPPHGPLKRRRKESAHDAFAGFHRQLPPTLDKHEPPPDECAAVSQSEQKAGRQQRADALYRNARQHGRPGDVGQQEQEKRAGQPRQEPLATPERGPPPKRRPTRGGYTPGEGFSRGQLQGGAAKAFGDLRPPQTQRAPRRVENLKASPPVAFQKHEMVPLPKQDAGRGKRLQVVELRRHQLRCEARLPRDAFQLG